MNTLILISLLLRLLHVLLPENSMLVYALVFLVAVSSVLIIFILYSRIKLKQTNKLLAEKNREITAQREEIQKQKDYVTQKTLDLLVLNKELKENDELRKGLTNMIVHDLKNPISNIINLSENREITFFATEILNMVENILDIQKYEGMILPLERKKIQLRKIAEEAVKQISLFAERKNIKTENAVPNDVFVWADYEIIRRVLVNLLSNAVKYSFPNGLVRIESEPADEDPSKIKITVKDNGIGIGKDKIPLIFNEFSQIIARKTGEARSTGIGLTFCKMAIEAHDSEITVESVPDEFTAFSFLLPKVKADNIPEGIPETKDETSEIILDETDKEFLQPFYDDLKDIEVYEIGKLRQIVSKIDDTFSENVKNWKHELNNAVYNCNLELFDSLKEKIN